MTAAPLSFLGQRGSRLKVAMVALVVMPSFLLFGYNNGSTGESLNFQHLSLFVNLFLLPPAVTDESLAISGSGHSEHGGCASIA